MVATNNDEPVFTISLYEPTSSTDTWRAVVECPPAKRKIAIIHTHSVGLALKLCYAALESEGVEESEDGT